MSRLELNWVFQAIQELTWSQRRELMGRLKAAQAQEEVRAIVEDPAARASAVPALPQPARRA